jgi:chorismate dehydratase
VNGTVAFSLGGLCYTWGLSESTSPLRVCAVSYLNTTPLVWGMLHGPQQGLFELDFQIPAVCADRMAAGLADIGIIPSFELLKQDLDILPGAGIACHGAVRSILLVSKCAPSKIATIAVDSSSRTSVQLARVILERRYGVTPILLPHAPDLQTMLRDADAALIIGDPALRIDPARVPYAVLDLGADWVEMTGLPMVFAVWAARRGAATAEVIGAFRDSCRYGRQKIEEIVACESRRRGFAPELVREYLTRHIVHELDERDYQGMQLFLRYASESVEALPRGIA